LSNIALGKIPVERGTDETERLQSYLNKATRIFFATHRYGIDQSDILRVAYQYDDLVSAGERPALEEQLSEIRGNISRKVTEGIAPKQQSNDPRFVMMIGKIDKAVFGTEVTDVENYVNVGGFVTGNVIVDATIKDSFNKISKSDASEELKNNLAQLTAAVAEMCKRLPEDEAKAAVRDLENFTGEATSDSPRRPMLAVIGDSLSKIAEGVEQYGVPVVRFVTAVVGLF
jgi:hypothetical protein